jgi:hypothetical protein
MVNGEVMMMNSYYYPPGPYPGGWEQAYPYPGAYCHIDDPFMTRPMLLEALGLVLS